MKSDLSNTSLILFIFFLLFLLLPPPLSFLKVTQMIPLLVTAAEGPGGRSNEHRQHLQAASWHFLSENNETLMKHLE